MNLVEGMPSSLMLSWQPWNSENLAVPSQDKGWVSAAYSQPDGAQGSNRSNPRGVIPTCREQFWFADSEVVGISGAGCLTTAAYCGDNITVYANDAHAFVGLVPSFHML